MNKQRIPVSRLASEPVSRHTGTPVHRHTNKGFTLLELLIAVSILAIVSLAVAFTFAAGLKVYSAAQRFDPDTAGLLLSLEEMERDIKNTYDLSGIDFNGRPDTASFAGLVKKTAKKGPEFELPGLVSYYFDDDKHYLMKTEKTYAEAVSKEYTGRGLVKRLAPAEEITFSYYSYDPKIKAFNWASSWDKPEETEGYSMPLAVKVKVVYKNAETDGLTTLDRTFFIPTAVSAHKAKLLEEKKVEKNAKAKE